MKKYLSLSLIFIFIISFSGCMTVNLAVEGYENPVVMTGNVNKEYKIVKHFKKDLRGWFTLFNLITVSDPDIQRVIVNEIKSVNGDAAINVKIVGQTTLVDGLIPIALGTLGSVINPAGFVLAYLVGARTYTVEGDIIKYQ